MDLDAGCPDSRKPKDFDLDGDGTMDGWRSGPDQRDETGKLIQIVCIAALGEFHMLVNGKSVGKCPWPGGRNTVRKYAIDADHNGVADDRDGDGVVDKYGWFLWISEDGPLPGETVRGVPVTHDNYGPGIDTDGDGAPDKKVDEDGDGLIDVTVYVYHGGFVTKRHFEIDWKDDMDVDELDDDEKEFGPTRPQDVPDDFHASIPASADTMANLDLASYPSGITVHSTERFEYRHEAFESPADITNGWPIGAESRDRGFILDFFVYKETGVVSFTIPAGFLGALDARPGDPVRVTLNDEPIEAFERTTSDHEGDRFTVAFDNAHAMRVRVDYT